MSIDRDSTIVNVISQNVLLDYRRTRDGLILPQNDRVDSLAATINNFPATPDVVGIQEAHKSKKQHNGKVLAEKCGYGPGFWVEHNQKLHKDAPRGRAGEYLGLFGAKVDRAKVTDLGDNRRALMVVIADVAFVTLHLRSGGGARQARRGQAQKLTRALEEYEDAVVVGDFNEPPIWRVALARTEFARAGFRSVFPLTGQSYPPTSPISSYVEAAMDGRSRLEASLVRRSWPIDDILIRGDKVTALAAGVLERVVVNNGEEKYPSAVPREGSDHDGVWATLEITP
jgi:endonuclease/exonuclease/phosphatase family metal-dependent hydrolase